jgi:chloramphenicol-sensitive protein RarD
MNDDLVKGVWFGLCGYVLWGLSPIFWKALTDIEPLDVLSWRILCTFIFATSLIKLLGKGNELRSVVSSRIGLLAAMTAGLLIGFNWGMYVWAVDTNHVVDAALGYFMNPLINVFLGVVILREKLRPVIWISVSCAALGVLWLTFALGSFPWISVSLACSFALYGLIRKVAPAGPLTGLTIETTTVVLPALLFLLIRGNGIDNLNISPGVTSLVLLSGFMTGIPLLLFASSARRIPLSILGLLQYITPTLQLLLGIFAYGEEFDGVRFLGYSIIWFGLAIFATESFFATRVQEVQGNEIGELS